MKESLLDHIYPVNPFSICDLATSLQTHTDHSLPYFIQNKPRNWLTNDHFLNVNYLKMKWIFLNQKKTCNKDHSIFESAPACSLSNNYNIVTYPFLSQDVKTWSPTSSMEKHHRNNFCSTIVIQFIVGDLCKDVR